MRYLFVLLLLTGCAQTMTLFPRPSGEPITGELRTAEQTMTIAIDGETYVGDYTQAKSTSVGMLTTYGTRPQFGTAFGTSYSNAYSALLVSGSNKTLRCEFVGALMETGNGVCQHGDGRIFDLLLKP